MSLRVVSLLLFGTVIGCKPTVHDFMVESGRAFAPYVTGDVHTAKAALLAEESVIAKHEAAGTPGNDVHQAYLITYARLCAVHLRLGDTNLAREYFQRAVTHRRLNRTPSTGEVTMESLMESISKLDAQLNPKWRQAN